MSRDSLMPKSLTGRTIAVLMVSVVVVHLCSLLLTGTHHETGWLMVASTSVMAVGVVVVAVVVVRVLTAPLRRLAAAADAIGHTTKPIPLAEDGPTEIRHVAAAFNAMQDRIHHLLENRTRSLAAVSHDLRTPLTRLRLRAGFVGDPEIQSRIDADLDEMEAMISSTLDYLRGEVTDEQRRVVDIAAVHQTLAGEANDAGQRASYAGPSHVAIRVRPVAIKRALTNVVGNAIKYGGCATIALRLDDSGLAIAVADEGPGIPPDQVESAFEPFVRLEQPGERAKGGVGLGLAIARQAIHAEGGSLTLANRPEGGLVATIELPPAVIARPA